MSLFHVTIATLPDEMNVTQTLIFLFVFFPIKIRSFTATDGMHGIFLFTAQSIGGCGSC